MKTTERNVNFKWAEVHHKLDLMQNSWNYKDVKFSSIYFFY